MNKTPEKGKKRVRLSIEVDIPNEMTGDDAAYLINRCFENGYDESQDERNLEDGECEDEDCIQLKNVDIGKVRAD
jgi:hypothetical protein